MRERMLVTGATGNVGSEVLRRLVERGVLVRAGVRDPAAEAGPPGAEPVRLDFMDPHTFAAALGGIDRLFLVRPPAISDVRSRILPFVDAAREAGVRHVVFLSLLGAKKNRWVPHRAVEDHLRASGMDWTFLRAGFFMQNLSTTHRADIRDRDEIDLPAGNGRTSFVDVRDLAAAAARVLTEGGHGGRAYDLTGAEALTYGEVAKILSEVLGRTITHRGSSLPGFVLRMREQGHPWGMAIVMAGIYTTARLGLAGRVSGDLPRLLGRPPLSVRQFAEDHRDCWIATA